VQWGSKTKISVKMWNSSVLCTFSVIAVVCVCVCVSVYINTCISKNLKTVILFNI
jgi:hypothetical protein